MLWCKTFSALKIVWSEHASKWAADRKIQWGLTALSKLEAPILSVLNLNVCCCCCFCKGSYFHSVWIQFTSEIINSICFAESLFLYLLDFTYCGRRCHGQTQTPVFGVYICMCACLCIYIPLQRSHSCHIWQIVCKELHEFST